MSDVLLASPLRERWARNEMVIAMTLRQLRGPDAALIAQSCGFSAIVVDCEHATFSRSETSAICLAARLLGMAALVRLPNHLPSEIGGALDGGASGVIVPHVENAVEAAAVARAAHYPPRGNRSMAVFGPANGYRNQTAADAIQAHNQAVVVVAMLESRQAVAAADSIAEVDGITSLVVGASDLAADLGIAGRGDHHDIIAANAAAAEACRRHGKVFTMLALGDNRGLQRKYVQMGAKLMLAGIDSMYLLDAGRRDLQALQALSTG